jgi:Leucine-rich repeat (LRR) protein
MTITSKIFMAAVTVVLVLTAAMFLSCSSKGTNDVAVDDDSYPGNIFDLRVQSVGPTSVTLAWTATGNDDTIGTATAYDMRISDTIITEENWDSAQAVTGLPQPSPYGTTDTMSVTGLMTDSTYFFAIRAQNARGALSWAFNCVSAMCFDDFVVNFPDIHLDSVIRGSINKPTGDIHRSDLFPIGFLDANEAGISDLSGIEYCINLDRIFVSGNSITNLAPLAGLTKLRSIQAVNNAITNIDTLAGLINLDQLLLRDNQITAISAMANLSKLTSVDIEHNDISSIAALAGKPDMVVLHAGYNSISDISALAGMAKLNGLGLPGNQITDISALSGLTKLTQLDLYHNNITDITPVSAMTDLELLSLWENNVSNIDALSGLTNLKYLYLITNDIDDISPLANLTNLQRLYFSDNPVSDISSISNLTLLTDLQLQFCQVVDISSVEYLTKLDMLVLSLNQIVDITPIYVNSGIDSGDVVYLTGNPLSQQSTDYIDSLTARGVEVNF